MMDKKEEVKQLILEDIKNNLPVAYVEQEHSDFSGLYIDTNRKIHELGIYPPDIDNLREIDWELLIKLYDGVEGKEAKKIRAQYDSDMRIEEVPGH